MSMEMGIVTENYAMGGARPVSRSVGSEMEARCKGHATSGAVTHVGLGGFGESGKE